MYSQRLLSLHLSQHPTWLCCAQSFPELISSSLSWLDLQRWSICTKGQKLYDTINRIPITLHILFLIYTTKLFLFIPNKTQLVQLQHNKFSQENKIIFDDNILTFKSHKSRFIQYLSVKSLFNSEKSSPSLSDGWPVTILYPHKLFVAFGTCISQRTQISKTWRKKGERY